MQLEGRVRDVCGGRKDRSIPLEVSELLERGARTAFARLRLMSLDMVATNVSESLRFESAVFLVNYSTVVTLQYETTLHSTRLSFLFIHNVRCQC